MAPAREGPEGRRLAGARQAGRDDLDRGRGAGEAALRRGKGRPCRHARPACLRVPADRARRGDEDGLLRHGRAKALPVHGALGRGDGRPTTRRARCRAQLRRTARPRRRSAPSCRSSPATIMQVPPRFSAIKIAGERAYDLAREAARIVELEPREIVVHRLELVEAPTATRRCFVAECGKGDLCARARPRHGPPARHARPCRRRSGGWRSGPFARSGHDFAGKAGGVAP